MIIDSANPSIYPGYSHATASNNSSSGGASAPSSGSVGDSVTISDEARQLSESAQANKCSVTTRYQAAGARLRKYINVGLGYGEANLTAMNFSRKNIGSRIESIIKSAGIKLDPSEKLAISVDKDDNIVVAGLKDKNKAKAIQDALNQDKKLAREMKSHVASARVTQNAQKQEEYEQYLKESGIDPAEAHPEGLDELFTSDTIRSWVVNDYILQEAGQSLDQLSLDTDGGATRIVGAGTKLQGLFGGDPALQNTVISLLEKGKTKSDFQVSFEFSNGTLSDPVSLEMAKSKIEGVKDKLMGGYNKESRTFEDGIIDTVRKQLKQVGGEYEKEFMDALSRGFSIRVKQGGGFEIVGGENMSGKLKQTLESLVQQALDAWAEEGSTAMDAGGRRVANFADVADTYIEQHRFEHGDVDKHEHLLEISFGGGPSDNKVVSPAADKAKDEENKELSAELGDAVRAMLGESGINTSGLEFEIDETGKITVLGDPSNADVSKAQSLLDQFCQEIKANSKVADDTARSKDKRESRTVGQERRDVLLGTAKDGDDDHVPEGFAKRDVVNSGDKVKREEENREFAKKANAGDTRAVWERAFPMNQKVEIFFLGTVSGGVSDSRRPQYSVAAAQENGRGASGARATAMQKYIELLNGMNGFHDPDRKVTYSLSAA
ncbi:MAG: hypothetical protein LUE17_12140 [Planctomycetaceae bacterium]|nr:hypothetical protein [Planctomycetaceae bacterium]